MNITAPRLGPLLRRAATRTNTAGSRLVLIATGVIVLIWLIVHLGRQTPVLLGMVAAAAGAVWLCRRRRDIVTSAVIAATTTALPGVAVIVAATHGSVSVLGAASVLTGHVLAGPLPTIAAWILRPAVLSRPVNAALGSAILLLAAVPVIVFGDHGFGPAVLIAGVAGGIGTVVIRHRRAAYQLLQDLEAIPTAGWTDLGCRALPDGLPVHLMVGRGYVLCAVLTSAKTIGSGLPNRSVTAALSAARALGVPASRVKPVVLSAGVAVVDVDVRQGSIRQGHAQVTVVPSAAHMADLAAAAPRSRLPHRRVLVAAAALKSTGSQSR